MAAALAKESNFVAERITAQGLEVELSGPPTAAEAELMASSLADEPNALSAKHADPTIHVPIYARIVQNSLASLQALTRQLSADSASWAAKGINFTSWGPDATNDVVTLHLAQYTPAVAAELGSAYGPLLAVATKNQVAAGSGRYSDYAPWYGGDYIYGPSGCTNWFSLYGPYEATAGHCGSGTWYTNGQVMGTTSAINFGGNMDAQIYPVSSNASYVYSDPTSVDRDVTGVASGDIIGAQVCTDGYANGEVCSVQIGATGQSVSYDGQTINGLVYAWQVNNVNAFSAGDSGGPVETTSGSAWTIAQGMIEARVLNDDPEGWYMPATTVTSWFGVSVVTG